MQHITNVLVHSNRCEVVDGHTFATGDKGLPHIHLQFLYMFGESSLQGKNLECKYLLPNGQYSAETVRITRKNEVTFPIHYSCFTVNGWTTLRITLINGSNRVTLEDIIIKAKETKLGEPFSNTQVEQAITQAIEVTTTSIRAEGETIKQELKNYIQQEKKNLKGENGTDGVGIENINSIQSGNLIHLEFSLSNKKNKTITFNASKASPFEIEIEELFHGNSKHLTFSKPLSEYQLLVIKNNQQTATIPAKIGSSFTFWYSSGTVQETGIALNYSGSFTVYGVKLNVQIAASPELNGLLRRIERLEEKIGGNL